MRRTRIISCEGRQTLAPGCDRRTTVCQLQTFATGCVSCYNLLLLLQRYLRTKMILSWIIHYLVCAQRRPIRPMSPRHSFTHLKHKHPECGECFLLKIFYGCCCPSLSSVLTVLSHTGKFSTAARDIQSTLNHQYTLEQQTPITVPTIRDIVDNIHHCMQPGAHTFNDLLKFVSNKYVM